MICADPWEETLRLQALLETELMQDAGGTTLRIPDAAFDVAESAAQSSASLRRDRPLLEERSTLGFLYAGSPYKIDHL